MSFTEWVGEFAHCYPISQEKRLIMNSYAFSSMIRSFCCTLTIVFSSFLLMTPVIARNVDEPPVIANTYFDLPTYEQRWTFRELAGERVLRVDGMADQM